MNMFARDRGIDRQDAIALVLQIFHDPVAWTVGSVRSSYQRDGVGFGKEFRDLFIGGERHGPSPVESVKL